MPKLALVVSALFLLGSATACGTSGSSDADKTTTTIADDASTTTADEGDTTTTVDESDGPTTTVGGGNVDADGYVAALVENLESNDATNGELQFDPEQAECTATSWVDTVGVETFDANGFTPDDLSESGFDFSALGLEKGQAEAMVSALDECGLDAITTLRDALSVDYDATQQQCLDAELDDETIYALLVDTLYLGTPGDEISPELDRIDETCKLKA